VKDIFAKKFLVPGEIPLAARSHRFFEKHSTEGRAPDAVGRCCVRHCAARRTGTCHLDSERIVPFVNIARLFAER